MATRARARGGTPSRCRSPRDPMTGPVDAAVRARATRHGGLVLRPGRRSPPMPAMVEGSFSMQSTSAIIRIEGIEKRYILGGEVDVLALRGVHLEIARDRTWPSWDRPAPANRPCSISSAAWIGRPPGATSSAGRTFRGCRTTNCRRRAANESGSFFNPTI